MLSVFNIIIRLHLFKLRFMKTTFYCYKYKTINSQKPILRLQQQKTATEHKITALCIMLHVASFFHYLVF